MVGNMEGLILQSMQRYNILPITSRCDSYCIFCSHHQNPPEVQTYSFGHRKYEDIIASLEYLDARKKIVIGESATKLIEGEPFLHPDFLDILKALRERFPKTQVSITTNGNFLHNDVVRSLKNLEPLEINLSLNAITPQNRRKLMGKRARDMEPVLKSFKKEGLVYHGSLVALPWLTGWEEITSTIESLQENNSSTVRVFLPGYTKLAAQEMQFPLNLWDDLDSFIKELRKKFQIPISLEPPRIKNLSSEITGVIKDSPAWKAGLKEGDIILRVNDNPVFFRVEAFQNVKKLSRMYLKINRAGQEMNLELQKEKDEAPGFVMDYDMAPETIDDILEIISRYRPERVLVLASYLGYQVLQKALEQYIPEGVKLYIQPVRNEFFGGSIMAAGLLVVEDFKVALREWNYNHSEKIELILLPAAAFDHTGRDLTGTSYWEIADYTDCPIVVI
ncbi:MAG: radical superfamily enzymePDZ protein [Clostridiales bacterium]|nr:radical superfamily enzymePDZ protein [Clostridiales bacterium]